LAIELFVKQNINIVVTYYKEYSLWKTNLIRVFARFVVLRYRGIKTNGTYIFCWLQIAVVFLLSDPTAETLNNNMCAYSCRAFRSIWRKMGSPRPLKGHWAVNSRGGVRENRFPATASLAPIQSYYVTSKI